MGGSGAFGTGRGAVTVASAALDGSVGIAASADRVHHIGRRARVGDVIHLERDLALAILDQRSAVGFDRRDSSIFPDRIVIPGEMFEDQIVDSQFDWHGDEVLETLLANTLNHYQLF